MRRFLLACTLLLTLTIEARAQYNLSIEECREMALKNNYNLKSSKEKILASEDLLASYKTNNLPKLSVNASYLYSTVSLSHSITGGYLPTFTPDLTTGELVPNIVGTAADGSYIFGQYAFMPDINFEIEVGSILNASAMVAQPIYMGGKVSNAIKLANIGVEVAKQEERKTEAEVIELTDNAFYTCIKVEEILICAEKYQAVVEEFYRQISNAQKAGLKNRNDVLKVEVKLNEAKLMTQKAKNGLTLARMNLCYAIGIPMTTTDIHLKDQFSYGDIINSGDLDITNRPEYAMLEMQKEAKELEIKITESDYKPSVTALASYGYTNGGSINGATLFNNASFSGGVTVSVPIFNWGEGRKKVSSKRRELAISSNQMEDLSKLMSLELLQSINNYNESVLEVQLTQNSVNQATENMRVSKNFYESGMETIADYLEAQALWQKAMSDMIEAKAKQRLAYTTYQKCKGEAIR